MNRTISRWITGYSLADPKRPPVLTILRYDTREPFQVEFIFVVKGGDLVPWRFARELLAGDLAVAGQGDVLVSRKESPQGPLVVIGLIGEDGSGVLEFHAAQVDRFLDATYELVPPGSEAQDVDAALAELLSDPA
jgi:hypothetical protein